MIYTVTEESGTKGLEQLAGSSSTGTPLGTWASFETDYAPNIEWLQGGTTFNPNTYPALAMYLGGNTVPERFDHSRPSAWETITLPTTSTTAITMQYDGQLLMTANASSTIIYKNGSEFFQQTTGGSHTQEMYLTFSKGDVFYVSSALLFCYVRYYKHPLFIKATPTSADSDYEGTLNAIREFYVRNNTYSTEERLTGGYWIDGKPIYRKCFKSNGVNTISNAFVNLNEITLFNGVVYRNDNFIEPIMGADTENLHGCKAVYNKQQNALYFTARNISVNYVLLTIEYTKTTD